MKILNNLIHPYRTFEKIRWRIAKKKLSFCGGKCTVKWDFVISHPENIRIGHNVHIGHHCEIHSFPSYNGEETGFKPELVIEDNVVIADYSYISCINKVIIGSGTLLGANTFITDNYHGSTSDEERKIPPDLRKLYSKGPVIIGKNVWTGRNVCIMPGIKIGDGAIIGANAVVTKDVPSGGVYGGIPAHNLKSMKSLENNNL